MELVRGLPAHNPSRGTAITVGAFDGIHLGHRAIIERVVAHACDRDLQPCVVTFDPHPRTVLRPNAPPELLTTLEEKADLLAAMGVDLLVALRFDAAMAATPARQFVQDLVDGLRMSELYIGPDFSLGRGGEGDASSLRALGSELGFGLHVVGPVLHGGRPISSSRIRSVIGAGDVGAAARMLGHRHRVSGEVVHGAGRGRTLGFPTANVEAPPTKLVPPNGVYAACAQVDGERHHSVVNVGVRPSFDNGLRTIEAHLLDFAGDLYGKVLAVDFIEWMRAERRFGSIDELVDQIQADCAQARGLLCEEQPPSPTAGCG